MTIFVQLSAVSRLSLAKPTVRCAVSRSDTVPDYGCHACAPTATTESAPCARYDSNYVPVMQPDSMLACCAAVSMLPTATDNADGAERREPARSSARTTRRLCQQASLLTVQDEMATFQALLAPTVVDQHSLLSLPLHLAR